jgi:hypothetical protein
MKLTCCAGVEAERFNQSHNHIRVNCSVCGVSFCLDRADLEAERHCTTHSYDAYSHSWDRRRRPLKMRAWYCSLAHKNAAGFAASESAQDGQALF